MKYRNMLTGAVMEAEKQGDGTFLAGETVLSGARFLRAWKPIAERPEGTQAEVPGRPRPSAAKGVFPTAIEIGKPTLEGGGFKPSPTLEGADFPKPAPKPKKKIAAKKRRKPTKKRGK